MKHRLTFGRSAVCSIAGAMLTAAACSHPATGNGPVTSGGSGDSSGGNSGTTTSGGNGGGTSGSGGSAGGSSGSSGSGGSSTPGSGGTNPGSGGSAGTGEVVVSPDAGTTTTRMSCPDMPYSDAWTPGYTAPRDPAVDALVQSMSVKDKADQMRGTDPGTGQYNDIFRTPDNTAKSIKGFLFRDGPRGVNLDADLPGGATGGKSTVFPVAMARGASWDMDLEERIGEAMGDEMIAAGQTMLLAPTTNILRNPLWGRAQETYGEDPFLLGRLGSASVVGIQKYVPACAKHYAANNIENGRATANAAMDEQTLREIYARHFEMMIKDGGVACIMAAYNKLNGVNSTQNAHLLNDLLRKDFGFRGFVLSDWWAMPGGSKVDLDTNTRKTQATAAVKAGMDMELPWNLQYNQLEALVSGGQLAETDLNVAAGRILEQKFRFKVNKTSGPTGLKTATSVYSGGTISKNEDHINVALEAALKSMVLLKNDNNTLPIKRATVKSVAVVGANIAYKITSADPGGGQIDFTTNVRTGDWGSSRVLNNPAQSLGPFDGIKEAAGAGVTVTRGNAASVAASADFVVVIAGLTPQDEGEEYTGAGDRASLGLDAKTGGAVQNKLITDVVALKKPMVVILEGGAAIDMPWLSQVPAVVMAWYPGMVGGRAMGKLLFGDENFSGKLPVTWPAKLADFPAFNSGGTTMMDYDLGYRYFDRNKTVPLFPFGFGLSYTKFTYSNLQVPCSDVTKNGLVNVQVDVTNTGTVKGDEVVLLFASYPSTTKRRPIKELKGFYRVTLDPSQTKRVSIPVRVSDLKYFDMTSSAWQIESGPVQVQVGGSSIDLPLKDTFNVK